MAKKPKLKTLPKLLKELQEKWFNPYIRERDKVGNFFICISCGQSKSLDHMQAGHFHSVGRSTALRFDEENVHGECDHCNGFDKDHLIGYTINLKKKIGDIAFNDLQEKFNYYRIEKKRWKRYEIRELIDIYKVKLKQAQLCDNVPF